MHKTTIKMVLAVFMVCMVSVSNLRALGLLGQQAEEVKQASGAEKKAAEERLEQSIITMGTRVPALQDQVEKMSYAERWKLIEVFELQRMLKKLGLYSGAIDGIYGRNTKAAADKLSSNRYVMNQLSSISGRHEHIDKELDLRHTELYELVETKFELDDMSENELRTEAGRAKVRAFQERLRSAGYWIGPRVNGVYDNQTKWSAERMRNELIQSKLKSDGYNPGKVDGFGGRKTGEALDAYSKRNQGKDFFGREKRVSQWLEKVKKFDESSKAWAGYNCQWIHNALWTRPEYPEK